MQRPNPTPRNQISRSLDRRLGITALEVGITIIVVLMLAALLLPAMQTTRCGGSRRSSCKNNLKQIGLALHNYHEIHNTLPPGWIASRSSEAIDPVEGYGWLPPTFGQFEHSSLGSELNFEGSLASPENAKLLSTELSALRCPSEPTDTNTANCLIPEMGTTSFVGNFGVGIPSGVQDEQVCQGIFGCNSSVRIQDITDGTANVVMVGERRFVQNGTDWPVASAEGPFNSYWAGIPDLKTVSPLCVVGTVMTGDPSANGDDEALNCDGRLNAIATPEQFPATKPLLINKTLGGEVLRYDSKQKRRDALKVTAGFSSWHVGGSQFLLSDGSVKFISENVDPETLINISRRADGLTVGAF